MNKLTLCVGAMIFTHFMLKAAQKIKHPERMTKEEIDRARCGDREQWFREHRLQRPVAEVDGKLMARDPSAALASIEQANLNLMGSCAK